MIRVASNFLGDSSETGIFIPKFGEVCGEVCGEIECWEYDSGVVFK